MQFILSSEMMDLCGLGQMIDEKEVSQPLRGPLEQEYRRFLALVWLGRASTPSRMVDMLWHAHISETERYARDCRRVGRFLYHRPHYEEVAVFHQQTFEETLEGYLERFGEQAPSTLWAVRGESGGCCACPTTYWSADVWLDSQAFPYCVDFRKTWHTCGNHPYDPMPDNAKRLVLDDTTSRGGKNLISLRFAHRVKIVADHCQAVEVNSAAPKLQVLDIQRVPVVWNEPSMFPSLHTVCFRGRRKACIKPPVAFYPMMITNLSHVTLVKIMITGAFWNAFIYAETLVQLTLRECFSDRRTKDTLMLPSFEAPMPRIFASLRTLLIAECKITPFVPSWLLLLRAHGCRVDFQHASTIRTQQIQPELGQAGSPLVEVLPRHSCVPPLAHLAAQVVIRDVDFCEHPDRAIFQEVMQRHLPVKSWRSYCFMCAGASGLLESAQLVAINGLMHAISCCGSCAGRVSHTGSWLAKKKAQVLCMKESVIGKLTEEAAMEKARVILPIYFKDEPGRPNKKN